MNILLWWEQRKLRQRLKRFQQGFDWAAGSLLQGAEPDAIELLATDAFQPDEFDRGALDAVRRLRQGWTKK